MAVDLLIFAAGTVTVLLIGPRLSRIVAAIADRTTVGHVVIGALLLGVVTSLPGLVLTVTAAARGDTELAVANALGGVAAQTVFIAVADIAYRRGTLSSGVPTRSVAYQSALLVVLLSLVLIGFGSPSVTVAGIHPVSPLLVMAYLAGLAASRRLEPDEPEPPESVAADEASPLPGGEEPVDRRSTAGLVWRFGVLAVGLVAAGIGLSVTGSNLAENTPLSATSVGLIFTALATSTPELVTAVSAARRGAVGLAAGDIIGGNMFDSLFVAAADLVAPDGVFGTVGEDGVALAGLALLVNGLLLAGLMRQGRGRRKVDVESFLIAGAWLAGVGVLVL